MAIEPAEIGRRIKRARERKGWTQLQLAYEANVSPSSVQRWESGKLPPIRELMRLADVLEVSAEEFIETEGEASDLHQILGELADVREAVARVEALLEEQRAPRARKRRASP